MSDTVWQNILHGLTMWSYKEAIQQFSEACGLGNTISYYFVEASRKKLEQLLTRPLSDLQISVMLVDGTIFKNQHLIVAIGIDRQGNKLVLGCGKGPVSEISLWKPSGRRCAISVVSIAR